MFLSISCDDKSKDMELCAPSYLPEDYQFCLNDSVSVIQGYGAKFLDQGDYRITDNNIYTLELENALPFFYSEFEVKNEIIVAMSFRTVAIEDENKRETVWNEYRDATSEFLGVKYQEVEIPERLLARLERSISWNLDNNIVVEMKSHISKEGVSEGMSLEIYYTI